MQWVYAAGSSTVAKRRLLSPAARETRKAVASGFFSGLSSFFGGGATPQRSPSPAPEVPIRSHSLEQEEADETRRLLQVNTTGVVLTVFSADVDVTLDERMRKELLRATKKNAPQRMKYELIYVGLNTY